MLASVHSHPPHRHSHLHRCSHGHVHCQGAGSEASPSSQSTPTTTPAGKPGNAPLIDPKPEEFNYNPQDRLIWETGTTVLPGVGLGSHGPATDKVMLPEKLQKIDGKYVYPDGAPRQNSAMAFASAAITVNAFREVFGEEMKWAFQYDKLLVRAHAGKDFNANYRRESGTGNFYEELDPGRNAKVHSGASSDIVAHEVGHAILDAVRPEYFSSWGPEPAAFHESFGDMMSIHMALRHDGVVARLLEQTGGDLRKQNLVAQMGEELGTGLNHVAGKDTTGGNYLRNAINDFRYDDPSKIPTEKGGPNELGWGKHSMSRLWTGAHYDVLTAMVRERIDSGMDPAQAVKQSNEELFGMLVSMLRESPRGKFTFKDMAIAFIQADKLHHQGKRSELLQKVFTERNILPADLPPEVLEVAESRHQPRTSKPAGLFLSAESRAEENPVTQVQVKLGNGLGMFAGATVSVPVATEEALLKSEHLQSSTESDIQRLIQAGRIRYNEPNYQMKYPQDYYNPKGDVYEGAVVWEDGQMKIERLHVSC